MKKHLFCLLMLLALPLTALAADLPAINNGQLVDLIKQNEGKVIMINFFATWCPPCRAEIPEIVQLRKDFPDSRLMIVGLSVDEAAEAVPPFIQKAGVNYPVYLAAKDITDAYNVTSVPHNAFIAPDGRLIISEPGMADAKVLKQVVADLMQ